MRVETFDADAETERMDYYLVDLQEETGYYVGKAEFDSLREREAVFLTDAGLVINASGELSFAQLTGE